MTTWLFVPGDRPERFARARAAGAQEVICDLEDAVAASAKVQARANVAGWLADGGSAWVRINPVTTAEHTADVRALVGLPGLRGFVLPKAESPDDLTGFEQPVVALVETAFGVHRAFDLAAVPTVHRLALGSIDLAADLGAQETDAALLLARSTLVLASRVAARPAPIDGVTVALRDADRVRADAARARELGFGGKLCVHPAQIEPVMQGFAPDRRELAWARAVLAGADGAGSTGTASAANDSIGNGSGRSESVGAGSGEGGARRVDGVMVDRPVLERARRILLQERPSAPRGEGEEGHATA